MGTSSNSPLVPYPAMRVLSHNRTNPSRKCPLDASAAEDGKEGREPFDDFPLSDLSDHPTVFFSPSLFLLSFFSHLCLPSSLFSLWLRRCYRPHKFVRSFLLPTHPAHLIHSGSSHRSTTSLRSSIHCRGRNRRGVWNGRSLAEGIVIPTVSISIPYPTPRINPPRR